MVSAQIEESPFHSARTQRDSAGGPSGCPSGVGGRTAIPRSAQQNLAVLTHLTVDVCGPGTPGPLQVPELETR